MKTPRIIAACFALGCVSCAFAAEPSARAAATENVSAPEWAELFGGASLPVVWQSASAAATKIEAGLAARRLEGFADWAETIHLAAHALLDQVNLGDPERQKRLNGALRQAAKIADDVLDAANHNEIEQVAASFRRLNAALKLVASRLPAAIVAAPPQTLRFAKAATPEAGAKAGGSAR